MSTPVEVTDVRGHVHQELTIWKDGGTLVLATFALLPHLDQWSLNFPRGLHRTGVGEKRALWWKEE